MADQLHNQLEKFLSRSRRRKGLSDRNLTAAKQTIGFRPAKQGTASGLTRLSAGKPPRITEDDPRWNASTMGNKTGYYKGTYYERGKKSRGARNYNKGNRPG